MQHSLDSIRPDYEIINKGIINTFSKPPFRRGINMHVGSNHLDVVRATYDHIQLARWTTDCLIKRMWGAVTAVGSKPSNTVVLVEKVLENTWSSMQERDERGDTLVIEIKKYIFKSYFQHSICGLFIIILYFTPNIHSSSPMNCELNLHSSDGQQREPSLSQIVWKSVRKCPNFHLKYWRCPFFKTGFRSHNLNCKILNAVLSGCFHIWVKSISTCDSSDQLSVSLLCSVDMVSVFKHQIYLCF